MPRLEYTGADFVFRLDDPVELVLPANRTPVIVDRIDGPFPHCLEVVGRDEYRVVDVRRLFLPQNPILPRQRAASRRNTHKQDDWNSEHVQHRAGIHLDWRADSRK